MDVFAFSIRIDEDMKEVIFDKQLAFLREIDRLKGIVRQSPLIDESRRENSAEHSWHVAVYALILAEHADSDVDISRVIKMMLIHDIVEIDAGDTPIHMLSGQSDQAAREREAADRLFGLLPADQGAELRRLWDEFEEAETKDAQFAKSLDRLQPLLHNIAVDGGTWAAAKATKEQVHERYGPTIEKGSATFWDLASRLVDEHFAER